MKKVILCCTALISTMYMGAARQAQVKNETRFSFDLQTTYSSKKCKSSSYYEVTIEPKSSVSIPYEIEQGDGCNYVITEVIANSADTGFTNSVGAAESYSLIETASDSYGYHAELRVGRTQSPRKR